MARKIALVALLLGVGVAIALYLRGFGATAADEVEFRPDTGASADARIAELERALAAQIERARSLDARLAQLESRLGPGGPRAEGAGNRLTEEQASALRERMQAEFGSEERADPAAMRERARERRLQRFVDAGIPRERAEWIERRMEELEVQAMQARYDAQRTGQPVAQSAIDPERALRKELGDVEYERYLTATGRPTQVQVGNVLASSAAERAGLQPGDRILSYAGTRVFDMRELNALTTEGSAGETVTVEVRRNGETVQLQVPRGPLGMTGGGFRGPQGGPPGGGPAGGFRGGR
jgi:hypothetical protein